jgi:putative oxidoreductase
MSRILRAYDSAAAALALYAPALLGTLARLVFAAVLLIYYWRSATTKVGEGPFGIFSPSIGGYGQILPKAAEAVGFDVSQLGVWHWAVVVAGTSAEFVLPALIVLGLFTRLAALGMIAFVAVQSLTDVYGHGVPAKTVGAWFDADSGGLILDQRALWVFLLVALAAVGAGPLSADRAMSRKRAPIR